MSRGRVAAAVLALAIVLSACTTQVPAPTITVTSAGTATAGTATPSASGSVPATESASPTPTPSVPAGPSVPTMAAKDVKAWPKSDFATPSGRIWCGITAGNALCHFPRGFRGTIPDNDDVCPGEELDVTGVVITGAGPDYFCSGDPSAFPVKGRDEVRWHLGTGYPFVTYDDFTLAVLPYGKALRHGNYVCASTELGVTCANRSSRHGFRIALAGVDFF